MILSGVQFNNFSGLNGQLKAAGLAPLNAMMFSLGGGAAMRFRQLIIGADLTWLGGTQEAVYANGLSNTLYVSTNALASRKWIFSPIVGIGSQDIHVRVNQPGTATSFVNALTGSYNQVELDHETIFLDLGMAFKIRWPGGTKNYLPKILSLARSFSYFFRSPVRRPLEKGDQFTLFIRGPDIIDTGLIPQVQFLRFRRQ